MMGLFGAYFYFVSRIASAGEKQLVCHTINVTILDSLDNYFITPREVANMVKEQTIGRSLQDVDTYLLEETLVKRGVIATAEAYIVAPDKLEVEITQREPVVRLYNDKNGFYADKSGFILPLMPNHPQDLPVVTGHLPIELEEGFRGYPKNHTQLSSIISVTEFIRNNAYWSREVEQIDIEQNSDLVLYMKGRNFKVIFGDCNNIQKKFDKLAAFYKSILESEKGAGYTSVKLKYENQILC